MVPDYSPFVNDRLGNDVYLQYFSDPSVPTPTSRSANLLEFLHYNVVLFDTQMRNVTLYGLNKESHIYSLLRPLTLAVENLSVHL
jgi:hypothetical protein